MRSHSAGSVLAIDASACGVTLSDEELRSIQGGAFPIIAYNLNREIPMFTTLPDGVVPLEDAQLAAIHGGLWAQFLAAVGFGFKVGQWVACAVECLFEDA